MQVKSVSSARTRHSGLPRGNHQCLLLKSEALASRCFVHGVACNGGQIFAGRDEAQSPGAHAAFCAAGGFQGRCLGAQPAGSARPCRPQVRCRWLLSTLCTLNMPPAADVPERNAVPGLFLKGITVITYGVCACACSMDPKDCAALNPAAVAAAASANCPVLSATAVAWVPQSVSNPAPAQPPPPPLPASAEKPAPMPMPVAASTAAAATSPADTLPLASTGGGSLFEFRKRRSFWAYQSALQGSLWICYLSQQRCIRHRSRSTLCHTCSMHASIAGRQHVLSEITPGIYNPQQALKHSPVVSRASCRVLKNQHHDLSQRQHSIR